MIVTLAACVNDTQSVLGDRAMDIVQNSPDWQAIVDRSMWHHVGPQLYRWLEANALSHVPASVFGALKIFYEQNRTGMHRAIEELLVISRALAGVGVPLLAYKGPVLARQLYGSLACRTSCDIDFLVAESDIDRALECLATLDYRRSTYLRPAQENASRRYYGQYQIVRGDGAFTIEMHWALTPGVLAVHLDYARLWRRSVNVAIDGNGVKTFAPEDQILVMSVHGSKEHWHRLKWINDVAHFVRAYPSIDWQSIHAHAKEDGIARILLLGVLIANRTLGAPLPDVLREAIAADSKVLRLSDHVLSTLCVECQPASPISRVNSFRLGMRERFRDRLMYVVMTTLLPRDIHFKMIRLPNALGWLYVPLRCIHDYLMLPLWNLGRSLTGKAPRKDP